MLQRLRHPGSTGRDDDGVERGVLGPAERAIAVQHVHVVEALRGKSCRGFDGQLAVTLDRVDMLRDLRDHCCRVTRAGADLEDRLAALQQQCLGHQRDDVRLRDRLAFLDRQRRVVVGELAQVGWQECLARHGAHCVEDERGADTAVHDLPVHH